MLSSTSTFRKFLFVAPLLVIVFALVYWRASSDCSTKLGNQCITLESVVTPEARARGLSGRTNLQANHGMLFVFQSTDKHCFWMKDMKLSIDMIWLDENKKVVDTAKNVSPSTYPGNFCPETPARYVIEVNAGFADKYGVVPGSQAKF